MKQPIFVKNAPIDEKRISFIETVLTRLVRRSVKKISAVMTPYPISACVKGDKVQGEILKYMFAARGTITKGLLRFDKQLNSGVRIEVSIASDPGENKVTYIANRNQMIIEPKVEVYSGDRLTISVSPIDSEETLNEVWISFLWIPSMEEGAIKSFLIEELDKIELPEE